jgi:rare lipoprotein A
VTVKELLILLGIILLVVIIIVSYHPPSLNRSKPLTIKHPNIAEFYSILYDQALKENVQLKIEKSDLIEENAQFRKENDELRSTTTEQHSNRKEVTSETPTGSGDVPDKVSGTSFSGKASWYGGAFAGRRTASGERFNPDESTAAHRSLPFGTKVRVTNRSTNNSTMVRINDRGPFVPGRVIDLSEAAFKVLAPLGAGVITVQCEVIK